MESNKKFMVGSVGSLKVFCMRGTRVPMDVVMDLKAVPKPLGPGSVHKGFYDRMDMVLSSFPLENSTSRVLVTGHSLGGGAAHCGYLMMKTLYPKFPSCASPSAFPRRVAGDSASSGGAEGDCKLYRRG